MSNDIEVVNYIRAHQHVPLETLLAEIPQRYGVRWTSMRVQQVLETMPTRAQARADKEIDRDMDDITLSQEVLRTILTDETEPAETKIRAAKALIDSALTKQKVAGISSKRGDVIFQFQWDKAPEEASGKNQANNTALPVKGSREILESVPGRGNE